MGFLDDLRKKTFDIASRAYDEANQWDGGKNWNQRSVPVRGRGAPSATSQVLGAIPRPAQPRQPIPQRRPQPQNQFGTMFNQAAQVVGSAPRLGVQLVDYTARNPQQAAQNVSNFAVETFQNPFKQMEISARANNTAFSNKFRNKEMVDATRRFADEDFKAGKITKQQRDQKISQTEAKFKETQKNVAKAEAKVGTQYNPSSGALDIAGGTGLAPLARPAINATVKTGKQAARIQTERVLESVASGADTIAVNPAILPGATKKLDSERVLAYANQIRNGDPVKPIVVTKGKQGEVKILDGEHRAEAYKALGLNVPSKAISMQQLQMARQGGYLAGPLAKGFPEAKKKGLVFDGVDGKPRFEVDDSGAKIKNPNGKSLGEMLDHPQLFKDYPQLKKVKIGDGKALRDGEYAHFNDKTNTIELSQAVRNTPKLALKKILHENQHAIQTRENTAKGGGLPDVKNPFSTDASKYREWANTPEGKQAYRTKVLQLAADDPAIPQDDLFLHAADEMQNDWASGQYRNLAGEAEARAVEARMNMGMGERYITPKTKAGDYVGSHQAPTRGTDNYHAPASDVTGGAGMYPDDIYTDPRAYSYYGHGGDAKTITIDKKSIELIRALKGKPDAEVTMYRAVPKGKATDVNAGDWVTLNKDYAQQHNMSQFDGKGTILEKKVRADELYTDGNSIHEFGYDPRPTPQSTFYDSLDVPKEDLIIRNGDGKAMSETPKTVKLWQKSKFSDRGAYVDVPVVRKVDNITLYQGKGAGEQRQYWTANKDYAKQFGEVKEKTGSFYEVDNGNRVTTVYVEAKPQSNVAMSIKDAEAFAAETSNPDEIAKDAVDYWYKHGKETKGGQLIDTTEYNEAYGSGIKRISEHNQFYKDFYKTNKRGPSKADYKAEVQRQLDEGGGSMVEPDMATAYQLVKNRASENDALAKTELAQVENLSQFSTPVEATSTLKQFQKKAKEIDAKILKEGKTDELVEERKWLRQATKETKEDIKQFWNGKAVPVPRELPKRLPEIDTNDYVKNMTRMQNDAQKGTMGLREKTSDFKAKAIDDLAPIEDRLNKAIKAGTSVDPRDHITYQLDRSRRSEGLTHAYIRDNNLDKIIQNVDDANEFDQYLIARHSKELDEDILTGRNPVSDAALVKQLDGKYGEAAKVLYGYNQKLLDTSVEYGLISKAVANDLKKKYPEYVPFNRIFNEDELAIMGRGNGSGDASISTQGVVKKIKGSNRAIASPLNSIIDKTRVVIEQGERNKAAQMLVSYKDLPDNPFNLRELGPDEQIGSKSTISFLDKGQKRTFETDKEIAEAAKHMTREDIGLWGRIAAVPARVLRGGATTLNVGFAGANIVKDVVGAAINSKHPFRIADPEAFGKALSAALHHNGKEYQELMREGVSGTSFDMFRNPLKSNVAEVRSQKNLGTRAAYTATHPSQWVRSLENTIGRSEDFGRALQYYSNKKGFKAENNSDEVAKLLAADQARHNSTNFFRHGSVGKNVNLAIPYWNAGVQGARIQARRIKERPAQTLGKMGFAIAAPSAMIAANNYMDPQKREVIENIPDYEKEGNIIIVGNDAKFNEETGRWEGVYKFPVPPQHIGIHKTIQDAIKSKTTGSEFKVLDNLGTVLENYTTIDPTDIRALANRYTPQALKLVAEPLTNQNLYTGNKIVPDGQKNLPKPDQYNEYTSGTAKTLGKVLNQSPRMIDNSIRTGMGGAGQNLVNASDSLLAKLGVIKPEEVQGTNLAESVTKRFVGANAISPGEKADAKFDSYRKLITDSAEYKNASQYDKGRMLNRLENDLSDIAYGESGKSETKLTKKQLALQKDGFKSDNYTNLNAKTKSTPDINPKLDKKLATSLGHFEAFDEKQREKKYNDDPTAEFRHEMAKYENDKLNGKVSEIDAIKREKKLAKLEAGSVVSKTTRDLYSLTKAEIYDFVNNHKDGEKLAEELLAYDRRLYDGGLSQYLKFKTGLAPSTGGRTAKSGGRKSGGRSGGGSKKALKGNANDAKIGDRSSDIATISAVSKRVASAKVATGKATFANRVRKPGIKAYKKPTATKVAVTRRSLS